MKVIVTLTKEYFYQHRLSGQPTGFAEAVKNGKKIHTCRDNYEYWSAKIEALRQADGKLCIREWSGKPYRDKQNTIAEVPAETAAVQPLYIHMTPSGYMAYVETDDGTKKRVGIEQLAANDGFSDAADFIDFFNPLLNRESVIKLAIIHFTPFRYGSTDSSQRKE
jgi:uncharacterized protein YjhX (UPF0386 family)